MQTEPFPEDDGFRVWLSDSEQELLIEQVAEEPRKQIAFRAMLHGLRSEELRWVRTDKVRELNSDEEAYKLEVVEGKSGFRETPISRRMKEQMVMMKNAQGKRKDEPLIEVTERTLQRWVEAAAEELAEETDEPRWEHLTPHDLRRSWATATYYKLNASDVAKSVVMRWGGWIDESTFERNYLGREPDSLAVDMMQEAGLR